MNVNEATPNAKDVLAYEAPFLIEKLLKDRIVETPEEGEAIFTEVKRFLMLVHFDHARVWDMYSLRVDEVWHQFILFTKQYMEFCRQFFGRYLPHSPSNSPQIELAGAPEASTFEEFQQAYTKMFGIPLSDPWYDERSVTIRRRILNDFAGTLTLRDDDEMVDLLDSDGHVLLSVNKLAAEALQFLAETSAFYVRELPELDDDEKIALVSTLVEDKVLRVGA